MKSNSSRVTWADILDPEMKSVTPEHWLQFEPPSMIFAIYIGSSVYNNYGNWTDREFNHHYFVLHAVVKSIPFPAKLTKLSSSCGVSKSSYYKSLKSH
ncbi:hypothetical protein CEXT_326731 [Caerostris extrusa]|uniref:Uncharacterized protein n=1 Tax=Caerostris extrusa TaxID=172846 RepID=A0AAV4W0Z9_CAEEX|nr:hypothetical protein CEXT_326731 [Caerostris extrusa]